MAEIKVEPLTKKSPAHNSMQIRNTVKYVLMLGDSRRIVGIGRVWIRNMTFISRSSKETSRDGIK